MVKQFDKTQNNKLVKQPVKKSNKFIYFDNNSTTLICNPAKEEFIKTLDCYNPSSDSKVSKPAKKILQDSADYILSHCSVSSATHTCIFTSGGSESNCLIIKSCVKAYRKKLNEKGSLLKPHIITSKLEHHSIIECLNDLETNNDVEVTYVEPNIMGIILVKDVELAIKPNTCLITIMYANNEIPAINNIKEIGALAYKNRIPLHSDCVQIFGKYKINLMENNINSITASAHKFYGPKGVGILIIDNNVIEGYGLTAEISGSQQHRLRGGTENVPGIAATLAALKYTFINRKIKNQKLYELRELFLNKIKEHFKMADFRTYIDDTYNLKHEPLELISLGPTDKFKNCILPNTCLLAVAKNKGKPFCNVELKNILDSKNCIVSIGSACLTKSDKASHVLTSIGAPSVIKRGVIRISFGDSNTKEELYYFIEVLKSAILKQCVDLA
jgi:cysteine desulfurase